MWISRVPLSTPHISLVSHSLGFNSRITLLSKKSLFFNLVAQLYDKKLQLKKNQHTAYSIYIACNGQIWILGNISLVIAISARSSLVIYSIM